MKQCTNDGCSVRPVAGLRRKWSKLWNEEVGVAVAEKRSALEK